MYLLAYSSGKNKILVVAVGKIPSSMALISWCFVIVGSNALIVEHIVVLQAVSIPKGTVII